ncbi:GumC family protein [Pedobacter sp. KACC 23697]|uniref:non-specific protein-tyrosine kinase n=1 Tax=Pedobacter sp. KACC 23697 TaxID=3149230 RepID=A0AAU7K2M7_9SPHI
MNEQNSLNRISHPEDDNINLKDVFGKLIDKWLWFLASILFFLVIAFFYTRFTAPVYQINAKILVNDDEKGGAMSKQTGGLMDLGGLLGAKNSVDNEMEILKTRFLMEQVVRQMQLNIIYSKKVDFVRRELYNAPFKILILSAIDTIKATEFNIIELPNGKLKVSTKDFEREVSFGEEFSFANVGKLVLQRNIETAMDKGNYFVTISSVDDRVATLMNKLTVSVSNKQVSVVDLGFAYPLPRKGEDILNAIINKYTKSNLADKNAIADSTYKFIKERLNVIASELGDVEDKVENFKQNNQLADMSEQGKLLVQNTGEFTSELAKAETQVNILNELEKYLKNGDKNSRVFPSSLTPSDMVFANLMGQYNTLLLERERQLLSVTPESPFVQNLDMQIAGLRQDILSNIQTNKKSYDLTVRKLKNQLRGAERQISGVPQIEKNYLKLARNQQIKQELYIFLMQKAEETNISKTSNISVAKTIDPPKAQVAPISPKRKVIYLIGIMVGVIFPIVIIFGQSLLNTTIGTKEDIITKTSVPVIGEISHNLSEDNLVVANQSRSAISEQFRALRTNLSFYLKNDDEKIILLTSSMSGEGKSFTAINLGNILALAGKKVLLMELDLRKPGLSAKLGVRNDIGFSNYTINANIGIKDIIKPLSINKNMFIISSGPLPPNPAETLMSEHISALISNLKKEFDYIIMDAPPIGVITDAQLLSPYANAIIYLVRQKVTRKDQLSIVEELNRSGKMKNMGIVVNDIVDKFYGYGYGYGNYGEEKRDGFLSSLTKIFKKN